MVQQTQQSGYAAPAIFPLRTLLELGGEGMRQLAETDLTPRLPFPVSPGWYERHWYADRPPSRWGFLASIVRQLCWKAPRVDETVLPGDRKVGWYARGVGEVAAGEIKGMPAGRQKTEGSNIRRLASVAPSQDERSRSAHCNSQTGA